MPVTVGELSEACTVFARSEAGIVGSNLTQGMDVWCVYVFILCLCNCNWEQMADGADNYRPLLTNQIPTYEPHCSPWNRQTALKVNNFP
jgi:hypothetical protein